MNPEVPPDFQWLVAEEAKEGLAAAQKLFAQKINPLKIAKLLRKSMPASRAALVMEQAQLRLRGLRKFPRAESMFFTGRSLEQSSSALIADYKALRFAGCENVADICCGVGGDLLSLARRANRVTGVDRDPIAALFAQNNAAVNGLENVQLECASFGGFDVSGFDGLHFDPDRRVGKRTTLTNHFQPALSEILDVLNPSEQLVGIKIAPGSAMSEKIPWPVEREWIGDSRECKQQVIWVGPGISRDAIRCTVIAKDAAQASFCISRKNAYCPPPPRSTYLGPYIYEAHATVLAAGLLFEVADHYRLKTLGPGVSWLNSKNVLRGVEPILKGYRVRNVFTVGLKSLAAELRDLDVGELVVKKRGVDQVLVDNISRLKLTGSKKAILMVTRHGRHRRAILVERMRDAA